MGASRLRYAPDGPYVTGAGGAPAEPGEGFITRQLRTVASGVPDLTAANITLNGGITCTPLTILEHCQAGMRVGLSFEAHMRANADAWLVEAVISFIFESSLDSGVTWDFLGQQDVTYYEAVVTTDFEGYNIDLKASIPFVPIPGHTERDDVRFRVRATTPDLGAWATNVMAWAGTPDTLLEVQEVL